VSEVDMYNGPIKCNTIWQGKSDTHVEIIYNRRELYPIPKK